MTDAYGLLLVDLLYLGVAVGLGLWFRVWLRRQQRAMDQRLARMDEQQARLDRLGERLQGVCRGLESVFSRATRDGEAGEPERGRTAASRRPAVYRAGGAPDGVARAAAAASAGRRDDPYGRARELLRQGIAPAEVARRVGLGIAEVNVLHRMKG